MMASATFQPFTSLRGTSLRATAPKTLNPSAALPSAPPWQPHPQPLRGSWLAATTLRGWQQAARQVAGTAAPRLALGRARAAGDKSAGTEEPLPSGGGGGLLGSAGLLLLWAALLGYAFFLSPNQTPLRDQYFLEKLVGLGSNDGVKLNAVFTNLFLIMGVWPLVYSALLVPAGRSANGVPAWPFLTLSYGMGAFGLLPYMALWQPPSQPPKVPTAKEELQGPGNLLQRGMESPLVAALCLGGSLWCLGNAAVAGPAAWEEYSKLLSESRFVHVTTLDFLTLTSLAPFWMSNDAELRKWELKDKLLPVLSVLPVVGPAIYLCLRPRAQL